MVLLQGVSEGKGPLMTTEEQKISNLQVVPLELKELNALVEQWHRHHKRVAFHRFSIGVTRNGVLVGGCAVGKPVCRNVNAKEVVEVSRLVSDGTKNVCSMLYSRAAKIAQLMGYKKIQTYILEDELGISLRASGWKFEAMTKGGQWVHNDDDCPRRTDQPTCKKQRWARILNE